MAREIPVFKPGAFRNFIYYLSEIASIMVSIVFVVCCSLIFFDYAWSLFSQETAPLQLSKAYGGVWTFAYQAQGIVAIPFLLLFGFNLKRSVKDILSKKEEVELVIDKKGISRTGHTIGYRDYYISGGTESFCVTYKAYETLQVGQKVKILYTPSQKNVRRILLLD